MTAKDTAKETKVEVIKVTAEKVDEIFASAGATKSADSDDKVAKFEFSDGAKVEVTKFRMYITNANGTKEGLDTESEILDRKDGAVGIKFVKATDEKDITAIAEYAGSLEITEEVDTDTEDKLEDADSDKPADAEAVSK